MNFLSFIVRLKFQKRSELKFVSRTIPQSGGYETLMLALGFHACDCLDKTIRKKFPILFFKTIPVYFQKKSLLNEYIAIL